MKRLLLMVCCIAVVTGTQAEKYRDFTDTQGRTIRGRIMEYNALKNTVKFERDNRKLLTVKIDIFSEADQVYIQDWDRLNSFENESRFKISFKRKEQANEGKSSQGEAVTKTVEDTHFEILLENKTTSELKGITLEYCIYYEQDETGAAEQGVYCGSLAIDSMGPNSKKMVMTDAVSIYKQELESGYVYSSGADATQRGKVHGISIRTHMKLPSGKKSTRESYYPNTMKNKVWASSSQSVGMN